MFYPCTKCVIKGFCSTVSLLRLVSPRTPFLKTDLWPGQFQDPSPLCRKGPICAMSWWIPTLARLLNRPFTFLSCQMGITFVVIVPNPLFCWGVWCISAFYHLICTWWALYCHTAAQEFRQMQWGTILKLVISMNELLPFMQRSSTRRLLFKMWLFLILVDLGVCGSRWPQPDAPP